MVGPDAEIRRTTHGAVIVYYSSGDVTQAVISIQGVACVSNDTARFKVKRSMSYRLKGPSRPRPPLQGPEERPWLPKLVLREAVASWACSIRSFAGR